MMNFDELYDKLIILGIATENGMDLVCDINGDTIETLNDILYSRTGYRDIESYIEDMG